MRKFKEQVYKFTFGCGMMYAKHTFIGTKSDIFAEICQDISDFCEIIGATSNEDAANKLQNKLQSHYFLYNGQNESGSMKIEKWFEPNENEGC
jgi:hypothetical protein